MSRIGACMMRQFSRIVPRWLQLPQRFCWSATMTPGHWSTHLRAPCLHPFREPFGGLTAEPRHQSGSHMGGLLRFPQHGARAAIRRAALPRRSRADRPSSGSAAPGTGHSRPPRSTSPRHNRSSTCSLRSNNCYSSASSRLSGWHTKKFLVRNRRDDRPIRCSVGG